MLLCRRDLRIGVLALKSLLHFAPLRWAVTLSDDGTLTPADRQWASRHVPGARWLSWPAAGNLVEQALGAHSPRLLSLYHSRYAPVCKLLHPMLLPRHPRTLVLDPDTAFFQEPMHLVRWAKGADPAPLYLHDHQDESVQVPAEAQRAFAELDGWLQKSQIPHPKSEIRNWSLGHRFFNSGLLAFSPAQLDLDLAEAYLTWQAQAPAAYRRGKLAIWFGDWTPEQTCYHVMFARSDPPAQPLGADYHLGGEGGRVFNHFLRHYLIQQPTLQRLSWLVKELPGR